MEVLKPPRRVPLFSFATLYRDGTGIFQGIVEPYRCTRIGRGNARCYNIRRVGKVQGQRMSWVREHVNEIPNRVAQAVVSSDPEQVRRVDSEVKAILDSMDVRELLEFADAVRHSYRWYGATRPAWLTMRPCAMPW